MIADLKPYAEYKESGLLWLGRVPGLWKPLKLKHAFKRIVGGSTPASGNPRYWNGDVTWVTPADVSRSERLRRSIRQISRAGMLSCSTEMVPQGSIVLTSRAPVGNVAIAEVDLCTNQGCKALIPDPAVIAPMFAFWLLRVMKAEIQSLSTGTTFSEVSTSRLGSTFGILPPPAEQAAIVRFLDWANGRLERAIRAKRKVIALLGEQKQAIIHRAVTRGLDPSVPLKPSGIPWLGDIPQHWEVSRIKNEFRCLNTQRVPLNSVERGAMTARIYDYYGASGVIDKVDDYIFDDELLLIAEDGANLVLRNLPLAIIARGKFWVNNHAHILKPRRGSIVYLAHVLETLNYKPWISGAAQPKLTQDRLMSISFAVAPPDEQVTIVKQTSEQTRPLVTAISRLEREIDLLREYRTRLVADVVTGKLDVREAVVRLPDEAPLESVEDDADMGDETEAADEEAIVE
jgi:type I restriction enzyme S subunit